MMAVTFTATEATVLIAVILAPVLVILTVALIRGYSVLFWHHSKDERLPFIGIVRPEEDDTDA